MTIWNLEELPESPRCIVCLYPVRETPAIVAEEQSGYWAAAREARRTSEAARAAGDQKTFVANLPVLHLECARKLAIQLLNDIALLGEIGQRRLG